MEVETREDDKRWKIVKVMDKRVSQRVEIEDFLRRFWDWREEFYSMMYDLLDHGKILER